MPIKSFRGLIDNGGQHTIRLGTNDGMTGYKINKFQIITKEPGDTTQDLVVKIYKVEQDTVPTSGATVDFNDSMLMAVAHYSQNTTYFNQDTTVIFDNEVVNQDIYITHTDNDGSDPCNYYLELEQLKLDLNEQAVATLKDIRQNIN